VLLNTARSFAFRSLQHDWCASGSVSRSRQATRALWQWMLHMRRLATLTMRAASGPPAVPLPPLRT
jgi:hypothetical protein